MNARGNGRTVLDEQAIRTAVRERYARAATHGTWCGEEAAGAATCCDASCCSVAPVELRDGRAIPDEIASASLGCGAPIDAAGLRQGETVIDLGSGAGLDVFLAADRIGPSGQAIGVDMTPEMIAKARANAVRLNASNVEFRLGEIEHLPVSDGVADVVVSNCVINLLPDKRPAFAESFRILRPGGRLVVSDIVSRRPVAADLMTTDRWTSCLAGAIPMSEYVGAIKDAGFEDVEVLSQGAYDGADLFSATIRAIKPRPMTTA